MEECFANRQHDPLWIAAGRGKPDRVTLFAGYQATVDFPGCTFWKELADYYPESKVVLSVRDPDKWFDSIQDTIFRADLVESVRDQTADEHVFADLCVYKQFGWNMNDRQTSVTADSDSQGRASLR